MNSRTTDCGLSQVLRALLKHSHGLVVQQTEDEWHVQLKNTGTVQFSDVASALESMADFISAAVFSGGNARCTLGH